MCEEVDGAPTAEAALMSVDNSHGCACIQFYEELDAVRGARSCGTYPD